MHPDVLIDKRSIFLPRGAVNEIEVHLFENFTALRFVTVAENIGRDEIINLENLETPEEK